MAEIKSKDMTTGNPLRLLVSFAIPIFFGMMFQQFYSVADTVIVGQTLGVDALAAVGATGSIVFMIVGFCNGVASGFAIPVAQRFGAKDEKGLKRAIANGVYLCVCFSIIITLFVTIYCREILGFMKTPSDIENDAYKYLIVIFGGIPITIFYNFFSGIMRSLGDSRTPVLFLVIASVINIVLDIALIVNYGMGVEGAAFATIISQMIAAMGSGIYMIKKYPIIRMTKEERRADMQAMMQLCYMGIPMGMQYSITAVGGVILQTAVNGLGSNYVAAMTTGSRIAGFFLVMFDALGAAMATFGGQNIGAKKLDRVSKGLFTASAIGMVYSIVAGAVLMLFGDRLALIFVDSTETEIIANIATYLRIESGFYFLLLLVCCVRFTIQGMGFSGFAVFAGALEMVARTMVALALVPIWGFTGVCLASPIAWIMADVFLVPAFFYAKKKLQERFDEAKIAEDGMVVCKKRSKTPW